MIKLGYQWRGETINDIATATAEKACAQLKGEASFKPFERAARYGRGAGCSSRRPVPVSTEEPSQLRRFTGDCYCAQQRGIGEERIDHDGATAALALYALKSDLHERQRHMQEAKGDNQL